MHSTRRVIGPYAIVIAFLLPTVRQMWSNAARAVPMMWLDVLATAVVNQTWVVYRGAEFTSWLLLVSLMDIGYLPWRRRHVDGSAASRLAETWFCCAVQWAAFRLILYPLHGLATVAALSVFCMPSPGAVRWMPLMSVIPPALTYVGYAALKKNSFELLPGSAAPPVLEESLGCLTNNASAASLHPGDPVCVRPSEAPMTSPVMVQLVPRRPLLCMPSPPTENTFPVGSLVPCSSTY